MSSNRMARAPLADLCTQVTDGTHDSPKLQPQGMPFIKGKHISNGVIDFKNCDYITYEDHLKVIARSKPERGDILFSNIGSVGDAAFTNVDFEFSIKNVALFKPDPQKVDNRYLYYYVISPRFQSEVLSQCSGSAQPFISLDWLRCHEIEYHKNLGTQRKIAAILSAYDDLIENNTRRIALLEEMAQLLYREWFVHFRFPDHEDVAMVDSDLGTIPAGWAVKQLSDLAEIVLGKTPSKKVPEYYDDHMLFIKIPDMREGMFCIQTEDMLSEAGVKSQDNKTVPENSLCVSCIGTIGLVSITSVPSQTNQQINTLVLERPVEREFLYFALSDLKVIMENYGAGATMTYLSKTNFSKLEIIFPTDVTLIEFRKIVSPIFEEIRMLQLKNRVLRRARDLLLPRLISGKLDVADLPIAMEAVDSQ